jgi:hypothetical protein
MNWLSWTLMVLAFIDPKIRATTDELKLVELARGVRSTGYRKQQDEQRPKLQAPPARAR